MMKKVICLLTLLVMFPGIAKMTARGKVSMSGSIVASACNLATESMSQQIDLGTLPVNDIARDGHGPERTFHIRLEDCEPVREGAWNFNSLRLTFDGARDGLSDLLQTQGEAKGIALRIKDEQGQVIIPGEALMNHPLQIGSDQLSYSMAIEGNNQPLIAGSYRAIVRFKVEYF